MAWKATASGEEAAGGAREFLAGLHEAFAGPRHELLAERRVRQAALDAGALPDFNPATEDLRGGNWRVVPPHETLADRRVEILAGPGCQGLMEALESGAKAVVVDLEDGMPPGPKALEESRAAVSDVTRGVLAEDLPKAPPPIVLRPRAWHRDDPHVVIGGEPMAASLVDAGLHIFHGAEAALAAGRGPFLTLPKLESAQEAVLWDAVLARCEAELGIAPNTVRAGVVIETLPAAFAVDEILHALRGRITHLEIGRRGMIRSFAATLGARPEKLLPDRERIVPGKAFLRALSLHVISRAHTRGTLALGGVSTQCLVDGDERAAADAKEKLRADAERAAMDGHDGMRVVQAAMVPVATEVFDRVMPEPNQLGRAREDVEIAQAALCTPHEGPRTQAGVRKCLAALLHVAAARLCGEPAASCSGEMLDIPAAEAAQALLTQWRLARAPLDDGGVVDDALVEGLLSAEADGFGPDAVRLARRFALADGFPRLAELEESEERLKPRVPGDFRHL